ncbi:hypothetical protein ACIRLA_28940 [Streptomyces sp. NPDC102364]|uniref:hypothetical protein n=1 Tax=Streptomyces sp. NPDC102364 TaxID=3366161 RepID=UPI00381A1071
MAEAKNTTVEQQVTETKKVPGITLTLTVQEAEVLAAVGQYIGGDMYDSPREHYRSISKALRVAGIRTYGERSSHPSNLVTAGSSVYFKNYPKKSLEF